MLVIIHLTSQARTLCEAHRVDLVLVANNLTPWSVESILNAVYHVELRRG